MMAALPEGDGDVITRDGKLLHQEGVEGARPPR
jgi:hypothetical protein